MTLTPPIIALVLLAVPFVMDRFFGKRRQIGQAVDSICVGKE